MPATTIGASNWSWHLEYRFVGGSSAIPAVLRYRRDPSSPMRREMVLAVSRRDLPEEQPLPGLEQPPIPV
jgi:hypothetical protein